GVPIRRIQSIQPSAGASVSDGVFGSQLRRLSKARIAVAIRGRRRRGDRGMDGVCGARTQVIGRESAFWRCAAGEAGMVEPFATHRQGSGIGMAAMERATEL